ncbi:MAG: bifunctional glutamate N-acetyltransferase/amino-acid acetyltransferase ArgJ [Chloroflexi bacterium]|nr:bifunctional glutamate N-acetyltransferase/amino-acid acetyltransferase ArgJ [Chloroflexota bacterium]
MTNIEIIPSGTVTSPEGFYAGAVAAGIKPGTKDKLDLGILFSEAPCEAVAMFTTNRIKAAPVVLSQQRLQSGRATAIVMNSGCANAFTGEQGMTDAAKMTELAAKGIGIMPEDVLVASTGVIGHCLPMKRIQTKIDRIILTRDGGRGLAKAIMTTDTVPKEVALKVRSAGGEFTIGGVAKGSGMIHPNLATMLCVLSTDARVGLGFLKRALRKAVAVSFNMISVDGDTSTNDMVLVMANGLAQNAIITKAPQGRAFQQALDQVCIHLAKSIARDGEGATKLIEVTVNGALSISDARIAARTVVSSNLVKAAVYGSDPNWGRVVAALGRSGVEVVESKIGLYFGDVCLVRGGSPEPFDDKRALAVLQGPEVSIRLELNLGRGSATAWGCDLTEKYVKINSEYLT